MFNDIENPKLCQILITAKDLIWKYGFSRVTVQEICREAGVSKMTFYKHFKNKNELVRFLVSKMIQESFDEYREFMARDIPFEEKVKFMLKLKADSTKGISKELLNEFYQAGDSETLSFFEEMKKKNLIMVIEDLVEAQKKGEVRRNLRPEFIVYFINQMMVMAQDPHLQALYDDPQELILELNNFFFYGILPRNPESRP